VGIAALGLLAASCRSAPAQSEIEKKPTWEFLVSSGTVVPTGVQRDDIKRGNLTAAQLSYVMRPELALTATLGWARSRDVASADNPKLDVFTFLLLGMSVSPSGSFGRARVERVGRRRDRASPFLPCDL